MPPPMAFLTILKDSVAIPANKARFFPLIIFVAAVEGILLFLSTAATGDAVKLPKLKPAAAEDLGVYRALAFKALTTDFGMLAAPLLSYWLLSSLLYFVCRSATAFLALDALRNGTAGKQLTLTWGRIKGPFITQLIVELFSFVFLTAGVFLAVLAFLEYRSQVVLLVLLSVVFLSTMFLQIVFGVSLIVSVDDSDVYGLAAVRRGWSLVGANWLLGTAVVGFYGAIALPLSLLYMKVFVKDGSSAPLWILFALVSAVIAVISQTAMASYYYICTVWARDAGEVYQLAPVTAV